MHPSVMVLFARNFGVPSFTLCKLVANLAKLALKGTQSSVKSNSPDAELWVTLDRTNSEIDCLSKEESTL